jgi:hypothetical protein
MNWYYVQDSIASAPWTTESSSAWSPRGGSSPRPSSGTRRCPDGRLCATHGRVHLSRLLPAPSAAPIDPGAAAPLSTCSQCGQSFSPDQLMHFEGRTICFNCKPLFVAQMKEGIAPAVSVTYAGF